MTRELDIEVGEKVMGWADVGTHVHCRKCPMAIDHTEFVPHGNTPDGKRTIVPEYSADISAAWLVVEKMRERGCEFELLWRGISWIATFDSMHTFSASTASEAICRAALAAMGAG